MTQKKRFGTLTPLQKTRVTINDLTFGVRDNQGGMWVLENIPEFENLALRGEVPSLAWSDGGYYSRQWVEPFAFNIHVTVTAPGGDKIKLGERIRFIHEQLPIREPVMIQVAALDASWAIMARVEDKIQVTRNKNDSLAADIVVPMVAADPRRFIGIGDTGEPAWRHVVTGLPASSGGLTVPFTAPFVIEGNVVSGFIEFTVNGVHEPRSKITIYGPVDTPGIHDAYGDKTIFNVSLAEDEFLEIRIDEKQVLLNGESSRRGAMQGPWPDLSPGLHRIAFSHAGAYSPDARIEIDYLEAY